MTIYLDVVLIENLCMNYIILFATGYLIKIKINHIRIILSSLLGALYSIVAYMQILEIYSSFVCKILLSIVMVYLAYNSKNIKELVKQLLFFYLISFVFGGCAFALLYFIKPQDILIKNGIYVGTYPLKIAILGGLIGFAIVSIGFHLIKIRIGRNDIYSEITIVFNFKKINCIALLDTGNMLKDPITRLPVIVVEKELLENILPFNILENLNNIIGGDVPKEIYEADNLQYIKKFRVIPFKSLGKTNGMLLGFKADKVIINQERNKKEINDVIIGIYDDKLSRKGQYQALIGLDLLEESDANEFFTNVSR